MIAVTMRGYDGFRSGVNSQESVLTAAAVSTRGIKKLFTLPTPDDRRGCEATPLILPGVTMADGRQHDVVYLATMGNYVYAYDANDGALLWKRGLGTPVKTTSDIDAHVVNDQWGIVSTPVIQNGVLYGCAWTSSDTTAAAGRHVAFAIDARTGADVRPPLDLEGATFAPGHGLPAQQFRSAQRKQRAALAISGGAVMIPFGTIQEIADSARGWLIAVDIASWTIAAALCTTARGPGAGVWMGGAGPAVLPNGDLAFVTGNGEFDGHTDFGESILRVRYTPPAGGAAGQLAIVDWWTPWSDEARTGGDPEGEGEPRATNFRGVARLAERGQLREAMAAGEWGDMDLGSSGICYVPSLDMLVSSSKDGVLYATRASNMGKTAPADLEPGAANQANYARLAFRPIFFTYYPPDLDPAPRDIETLNVLWGQRTHHQHGSPLSFASPEFGPMLFNWGENGNGRAWQLTATACTYLACTVEAASPDCGPPAGGMPGAMLSLSCNAQQPGTAVLWACVPYGDANVGLSAGRLIAYAATQFNGGHLIKLWDSQDWGHQFTHNKFNVPVVSGGKLFLPTYDGSVIVYGLA